MGLRKSGEISRSDICLDVLGPVELSFRGNAIELGGIKTRALLARLLIDHNLPIPVDTILESVWPDAEQGKSEVTLRSMVSRLRQRLRAAGIREDLLVTRSPGYALLLDPEWMDATHFARYLEEAKASMSVSDPAQASALLSTALGLWRGPAFGDIRGEAFALPEARRLEELRLNALETRIDAELMLGHHHEIVGEMETLTKANWTRERLWRQWMLALYRCGRQAEALRVFQDLRSILIDELGVEPGLEASALEHQILVQSPELGWTEPGPPIVVKSEVREVVPLPNACATPPPDGFVGRDREKELLTSQLNAVTHEGTRRIVFVGGEPGIGKTALATEFACFARQSGATVLYGRADEDFCAPYQPWAEALSHLVVHASRNLLASLSPFSEPLVQMIPRLAARLGPPELPATTDSEAARYVWFGAVQGMLQAAGHTTPLVLILDDMQWADVPSLRLLRHIVTTEEATRLLVVAIYREFGETTIHPLAQLLGDAQRMTNAKRIDLQGLTDLELQHMMEGAAGHRLEEEGLRLRDALLVETDGNPFFVNEMLQHLADTGSIYQRGERWLTSTQLREQGLPISVREVIGQRVARLGDLARRVLSSASVIGREFDYALLAATCDIDDEDLLNVIDLSIDAQLIVSSGPDRYRFVHALIEHTVYDSIAPTRRAHIHRKIAQLIEGRADGTSNTRSIELAHHWSQSNDPECMIKAAMYARAAGDEALHHLAPDDALQWYIRALNYLGDSADEELRCRLLIGIGTAQNQTGDPAFRDTLLSASRLADEIESTELLVAAALSNSRGYFSIGGSTDVDRVE